ncbi:MAG: DGQHR domain-containing protein [Candidatus Izemoplasmatales bacterium]|nr:DGQHR domain-containing protein [Candidatus Izemoplasmatales bacterium]
MTTWNDLVLADELHEIAKTRKIDYHEEKVLPELIEKYQKNGWTIVKQYKDGSAKMKINKKIGDSFEDEVWMIFYKMGFKIMNKTNDFKLSYSKTDPNLTKQIDVIAIDDEVCLLIECKSTEKMDYTHNWKTDLESIQGIYSGLSAEIKKQYKNRKIKYIFATKNYVVGEQDSKRMDDFRIANFDYEVITYYKELVNHLGSAARYQLLGNLFAKQKIKEMEEKIPAIEGKMGGLKYYSFLIEPEKLLKVSYVLHRSKANHKMMPTYQRLIKKDRLKSVREYVNNGGYFPNSLIVSIDTNNKGLKFDLSTPKLDENNSRVGHLYLPQTYQSVYVIDGQHRLYGYSDTNYADNNTIPVVAFLDLDKNEQVRMFMDINQNQKAVSKSLRNTLNIDLLWDSDDANERKLSLMLSIAQELGEDKSSPLYGRVVTGEDSLSEKRCITIEYLKDSIAHSSFLNTYKKSSNSIIQYGTFDKNDNDKTSDFLFEFLKKCLKLISTYVADDWEKGSSGYVTINNSMYGIIRIIDDIVNIILIEDSKQIVDNLNETYKKCEPLLLEFIETLIDLDQDSIKKIKEAKGGAAKKTSWRTLQVAFNKKNPKFSNPDLERYIIENCTDNNPNASDYINRIEIHLKNELKNELLKFDNWMNTKLPENLTNSLISQKAVEDNKRRNNGNNTEVDVWDFISFDEIMEISKYKSNWSEFCANIMSKPNEKSNKVETLGWLKSLSKYKNNITSAKQITTSEFNEINAIFMKFFGEIENREEE